MKTYNCISCNVEAKFGYSKTNKFCSNRCQGIFKWVNETVPRIEAGNCGETSTIRKYLIEKQGDYCTECNTTGSWQGKPLTLHVDHIDGNSDNNAVANLRLLCPNCHSQTDTWGSKGGGNTIRKQSKRAVYSRDYRNNASVVQW